MFYKDSIIIIPARINSKRLKNKPLQKINGKTLIRRVVDNVKQMNICDFIVATDSAKIQNHLKNENVVITDKNLKSGSDRCKNALDKINNCKYRYIVDLQGDMLNFNKQIIIKILQNLHNSKVDIVTAVYKTNDVGKKNKPQFVKTAINFNKDEQIHRCLYFSRSNIPFNNKYAYIHIGIYGYTAQSLTRFANLEQSMLEKTEKLEQLRALENNMSIYTIITNKIPISIDTIDDLKRANEFIK